MSECKEERAEAYRRMRRFHKAHRNGAAEEKHRKRWQKALHTYLVCRGITT